MSRASSFTFNVHPLAYVQATGALFTAEKAIYGTVYKVSAYHRADRVIIEVDALAPVVRKAPRRLMDKFIDDAVKFYTSAAALQA